MSKPNEQALDKLNLAIMYGLSCDGKKRPGAVIQSMKLEDRKILEELTSEDTEQQRPIFLEK